ncbi:MAG: DUF1499 domain-containing protein [Pseudomonadota bacterium]
MAILRYALIITLVLALAALGGLFYLGQMSKAGTPLGLSDGQLAPCPESPNCASSEAGTESEKLVNMLPDTSWSLLPVVIVKQGGEIVTEDEDYIAATYTSGFFGFVDDIEFRKSEDGVHVRSASRVGYSDAGANKARIEKLRETIGE